MPRSIQKAAAVTALFARAAAYGCLGAAPDFPASGKLALGQPIQTGQLLGLGVMSDQRASITGC